MPLVEYQPKNHANHGHQQSDSDADEKFYLRVKAIDFRFQFRKRDARPPELRQRERPELR